MDVIMYRMMVEIMNVIMYEMMVVIMHGIKGVIIILSPINPCSSTVEQ